MIDTPHGSDGAAIVNVAASTGFFSQEEVDCVAELWEEYRQKGAITSGYHFLVDRQNGNLKGFACYGPHALAEGVYDLFWIAVDKAYQGKGVGKVLMHEAEKEIKELGGRLVVVETSGQPKYEPTRGFYRAAGYTLEATLKDFYHEGDDLVIFTRKL
jgi:ribosomal protein S18 acetylase RimI-like enzyme